MHDGQYQMSLCSSVIQARKKQDQAPSLLAQSTLKAAGIAYHQLSGNNSNADSTTS